jgi:hypothetical protein
MTASWPDQRDHAKGPHRVVDSRPYCKIDLIFRRFLMVEQAEDLV